MAVKQAAAAAAAALAYGYDYAMGSNPTLAKAAIAGLTDAADYLSKSMSQEWVYNLMDMEHMLQEQLVVD